MIESYPLYWPEGRPRNRYRNHARFDTTFGGARDGLVQELCRLNASEIIVSTNIPVRRDGLPYATCKEPLDPGVAVYFTYKKKQHCFACDQWLTVKDNIQAIRKTIEALRGIARWGTGDMMEQAFRGFEALPVPMELRENWRHVLGVKDQASLSEVKEAYHLQARKYHSDLGGSEDAMKKINWAYEQAKEEMCA